MSDTDLAFASIEEVGTLFRKRKLSPVELTKLMLARIERLDPKLNSYISVTSELALAQAKRAETEICVPRGRKGHLDRGPLHGVPISLKDNIYTAGIRTTAGSKILRHFIPLQDAPLVTQLQQAGAVILGKTNMHEFAYGVTSNNPHYGPVHNPWDLARIPGGSSGGSASAVAAGLCYGSIGTDTGGSIRIPAALCGVVGLKPTIGRVPTDGTIPLSPRLDCVGPLARTVQDAAFLLDPILVRAKREPLMSSACKSFSRTHKFKLGLPSELFFDVVSDDVLRIFQTALHALCEVGAKIEDVSMPLLAETEDAGNQIAWPEATHYHQQAGWFPARASDYGEDVRSRLEMGAKVSATGYLQALELRDKFIQQLHLALADSSVDALVVPTTPIEAPLINEETTPIKEKDYLTRALLLRNNRPANLSGVPAISIPCSFTAAGLPVGLQLIGPVTDEHLLLRMAHVFEQVCPQKLRPPL
jgi:aspartyl-tRNA(Asn)/glutamyl-tRNA(Gln) amidotransferase subunit A